ncbi:MAG: 3',5'-cyclic-nucleotide phosphodiesterase [Limnobacter sp.]|uniref:3',5'-cyclic-nucleotide phosphodiesterase n=1 Tax=Limnobacter sp. TaxID=2003368 RepID=UPI0022C11A6C|nr:3',5'-cyclic-nucleotide phosphodiesterase [Limnobacter sp.]MCZ8016190.1 3',5'-cyclic-nucleotide phosphodiesterase [Limnobacter sp.]
MIFSTVEQPDIVTLKGVLPASLEVFGCSGSVGDPGNGTSCFLLNQDVLIDAGSGVMAMTTAQMSKINHVLLTHTHLDHVSGLPFLVESRQHSQASPLCVYAQQKTIDVLRQHVFNDLIWPDFTAIPSTESPALKFVTIQPHVELMLGGAILIPFAVNHSVPTLGFVIKSSSGVLAISSDTYLTDELSQVLNSMVQVDHLIIESSFSNKDKKLSELTLHLCPSLLATQLNKLDTCRNVWVSYLKEWDRIQTEREIEDLEFNFPLKLLRQGQTIRF